MINSDFLTLLVCPATKQSMFPADAHVLAALNAQITQGKVVDRSGQRVTQVLEAGLVCQDGSYCYRVEQGIPVLLEAAAIALPL